MASGIFSIQIKAQNFYILGDHPTGCVQGSVEIPFAVKFQMYDFIFTWIISGPLRKVSLVVDVILYIGKF